MKKIRVLVVDAAVVVRRIVADVLAGDPQIDVVGAAANGKIALQKIPALQPDLLTLDVEMPEMDGLETLRHVRRQWPNLPVIMFSTLTERGAATTLAALALGATDYVTKPANVGSVTAAMERIRVELIPKIKTFCGVRVSPPGPPPHPMPSVVAPPRGVGARPRIDLVVIGVSTGGPNALAAVVPVLPETIGVPICVVQHMPPVFTRLLAERLSAKSKLRVVEARQGDALAPGVVYIAPGDSHLVVERHGPGLTAGLTKDAPENSCRPAVDVLFRAAARTIGANCLAVVLTGMGQDGLKGCEDLRRAGGSVIVQDEATSVVWGMPGLVARAGLAERILPLEQIGHDIARRVAESRGLEARASVAPPRPPVVIGGRR